MYSVHLNILIDVSVDANVNLWLSQPEVLNLSLTMYPFSISTDEHVPLKFLMTKA